MIVSVLHPAPLTHVPRRGHVPRHDLVAMRTPVELRAVSLAETTQAGPFKPPMGNQLGTRPLPVRGHGGRTWVPLAAPTEGHGVDPGTAESLAGYLTGESAGSAAYGMVAEAFSQTPLSAPFVPERARPEADPARGTPEPDLRAGRIERDGRETAAAAVKAHLDAEVLLIDGAAWVRFRPLLSHSMTGTVGFDVGLGRLHWNTDGLQSYDPADFASAIDDWHMQATGSAVAAAAGIARLHGPAHDGHALLHNLNRLPGRAAALLRRLAEEDRADLGAVRERTTLALRACEDLAVAARLGGIGAHEAPHAARILAEAFAHLTRHDAHRRNRWTMIRGERYLTRFAIPRADALSEPEPADLVALHGLTR